MKALAALMAEGVDFVTVSGTWQKSPKEFEEYYAKSHVMQYKESVWTLKSSEVKFIKPDVAMAHVEWSLKGDKDADERRASRDKGYLPGCWKSGRESG